MHTKQSDSIAWYHSLGEMNINTCGSVDGVDDVRSILKIMACLSLEVARPTQSYLDAVLPRALARKLQR